MEYKKSILEDYSDMFYDKKNSFKNFLLDKTEKTH